MKNIPKAYEPQNFETELYKQWEEKGYFKPETSYCHSRESGNLVAKDPRVKPEDDKVGGCSFSYDRDKDGKPFVISMPPPNVTGKLHMGHAMFVTLEDILTRYHRLKGEPTLWLPGTDHAGIATQTVVDKELRKQGINRHDLGREKFVEKVWEWKERYGGIITEQIKRLGASCDWSRERFTLDEGLNRAVREAFVQLYEKGLIYRGLRVVNWCSRCQTAISDDEVEYEEQNAKLYYFKYDKNFPVTIATTRPETKLGDTGVAVNPDDRRYQEFVGKSYEVDIDGVKRTIKIIANRSIDKEFGTGAVGLTPAHSFADWKMAEDNGLPVIKVIDEYGKMTDEAGKYTGIKVSEAREKLVEYLKSQGLLEKEQEITNNLSKCYRCGGSIEPIPSKQWFVKMRPLADKAKEAVESGEIKIIPNRFDKVYYQWMDNIRDWCVSRQLWWGHQIPVWYRQAGNPKSEILNPKEIRNSNFENSKIVSDLPTGQVGLDIRDSDLSSDSEIYVGVEPPEGDGWVQDEDVLDTWFSSALWPFSTLGWPQSSDVIPDQIGNLSKDPRVKPEDDSEENCNSHPFSYASGITNCDYQYFYPTSVMETGYDILFFWVARMIMFGLEFTGKAPFETVYLHGLVRDEQNRKMSKSLGNVLDPLDLIPKYGTDAMRMALVVGSTPGQDIPIGEAKIKGYRNFSNKIWNASRYVILRVSDGDLQSGDIGESRIARGLSPSGTVPGLTDADKAILKEHEEIKNEVTRLLDEYKFSLAGEKLYEYFWHSFADVYIEASKAQLQPSCGNGNPPTGEAGEVRIVERSRKTSDVTETGLVTENRKPNDNESIEVITNTKKILMKVLSETLIMLHPFMPFVTEAVWQDLRQIYPKLSESIMIAKWPK